MAKKQYPASKRRWYFANRARLIRRAALWQRENKAAVNQKNSEWKKRNPLAVRAMTNARRRKLRNARPEGVDRAAIRAIYRRCQKLRQWFDVVVDHIVPLAKGGTHSPENLQIIYASENMKKHTRTDFTPQVIFA